MMEANIGYQKLLHNRHEKTIWTRYSTILLGIWLIATSFSFQEASLEMISSNCFSGVLLILFGYLSLEETRHYAPWTVCAIGIWLQLAPLVFWEPSSFGYLNATMTGVLAIMLSIVIPGSPGIIDTGPEVPDGWSYNPSSWLQRVPVILFAFIAWMSARYMAAYQLGYIDSVVDPFFTDGTLTVITSNISKAFPVSDAGLGAFCYTLEAVLGAKGGTRRWHTMPWIVAIFGFLVVPVGVVSIILIMLQPLVVGAWCFWCLLTALCMLIMVTLTVDEVIASGLFLYQATKEGKGFWHTFWKGSFAHGHVDTRSPPADKINRSYFRSMWLGATLSWNLFISAAIGVWLMFEAPFLDTVGGVEVVNHIVGALVVAVSIFSMAELLRPLRFINILFGLVVLFAPYVLESGNAISLFDNVFCGIALLALSFRRGKIRQHYGSLEKWVF